MEIKTTMNSIGQSNLDFEKLIKNIGFFQR